MKYVMLESLLTGIMFPIFCTSPLQHADLAVAFKETHKVCSAGFCEIGQEGKVRCGGFSSTLNLGPAANDAAIIEAAIRATIVIAPKF